MRFVLLMAAREVRASWRRLLFFFVCVAVGVGAIVALRSIIQSVRDGLSREARAIVGGDVAIATNRPISDSLRAELESAIAGAPVAGRVESISTPTMARPEAGKGSASARMVELRGVGPAFPLYGTLSLQNGLTYSHDLLANHGALVRPELLAELGISVGDRVVIGGQPYTIRGIISEEPGRRAGSFSLGSRVLVDLDDLRNSGLLSYGSRANYEILLKMPASAVDGFARTIRAKFRDRFIGVRTYRSTEDAIGNDMARAENHLSLVGFVILVLGGIGVWSVTRVFVRQKVKSVAILKCLGATTGQVLAAYVAQVVLLGLAGSALGVGLAKAGIASIPPSIGTALGVSTYGLTRSAVAQGVSVGMLVSLLFSVVPLLEVRRVKPLLLIRGASAAAPARSWWTLGGVRDRLSRLDYLQLLAAVIMGGGLVAIASWQAASLRVGAVVVISFAAVAFVLNLASAAVIYAVRPIARARSFSLRHAVLSLGRPGNQTRVILLAVGLGSFFVIGVRVLQSNLLQQFSVQLSESGADMFLIEILPDQVESVRAFLEARKAADAGPARLIPVLRARVTGVRAAGAADFRDVRNQGREYTITYRDHLEPNEKVLNGTFWPARSPLPENTPLLEVSIEENMHDNYRVNVGDVMQFDVLGRVLPAKVTSIRKVEWEDARNGGFMFVFRPGPFAHAPQTWIGILRAPQDPTARGRFQRDLATAFPNVSAIDVREILVTIERAVHTITIAISVVGGVALGSGVLILIGAVAMTKFQRVYEAAILRTLGASTRTLGAMLAFEYATLGLLAGLVGGAGAMAFSWAVCRHVLDIPWRPQPLVAAAGMVLTTVLVGVVGLGASYDVLRRKPLGTLRAE
ncbi:MAG TPA: FtsX-like permease family protein [Vicinamibacterales bacterium]|nr:FtsX-like permease family protein [Vicinamibacterales bacterium]